MNATGWWEVWAGQRMGWRRHDLEGKTIWRIGRVSARHSEFLSSRPCRRKRLKKLESEVERARDGGGKRERTSVRQRPKILGIGSSWFGEMAAWLVGPMGCSLRMEKTKKWERKKKIELHRRVCRPWALLNIKKIK